MVVWPVQELEVVQAVLALAVEWTSEQVAGIESTNVRTVGQGPSANVRTVGQGPSVVEQPLNIAAVVPAYAVDRLAREQSSAEPIEQPWQPSLKDLLN